jgi:AcrR family transcriptional regulator
MSSGKAATRERILKTAWLLMMERRGQEVLVDDIARAANLSRQAVYLHFRTRADLLVATVRYVDEVLELDRRLEAVCAARTGVEILDGLVEFWGNYIPQIYGLAKALLAVYDTDADAAAAWNDRMTALRDGCRVAIRQLAAEGRLAEGWEDIEEATGMMWGLLAIEVWENLTLRLGWSNERYIQRMKAVLHRTFVRQ